MAIRAPDGANKKLNYQYSGTKAIVPGHQNFGAPPDLTGRSNFGGAPKFWCPGTIAWCLSIDNSVFCLSLKNGRQKFHY